MSGLRQAVGEYLTVRRVTLELDLRDMWMTPLVRQVAARFPSEAPSLPPANPAARRPQVVRAVSGEPTNVIPVPQPPAQTLKSYAPHYSCQVLPRAARRPEGEQSIHGEHSDSTQ